MNPISAFQHAGQFSDAEMKFLAVVFVFWLFGIIGIVLLKMTGRRR